MTDKEPDSPAFEMVAYLIAAAIVLPIGWWVKENYSSEIGQAGLDFFRPFSSWFLGLFGIS